MSTAKYPNRDALREANDIYLDAMYPFVSKCLDKFQDTTAEELIRNALSLASHDNIEEKIEISDIAHLVRTYWYDYFKDQFEAIDPHYEARSAISLIVEGRNRASHPPWDLDSEFTRTQLFLVAEVLRKIDNPDAQREVEAIRDKLFDDTTGQLVTTAVEAEKAKYEKSIAKVKGRLAAAEKDKEKLSKKVDDNAAKLDKKKEELEKLSEQLVGVKLSKRENEKHLNSVSKQLEKMQAAHSTCEERLITISNQLTSTETERGDYKKLLETTLKELEEAETEWQACWDSLVAMRNLFTVAGIGKQEVFQSVYPPIETDSTVRILDRRGVDKKNYLLELLEQKQPTLIYVQSEEMADLLLEHVVSEKADFIEKHGEQTSEAEEAAILEKLESGELIAAVSNTAFSKLTPSDCVEHFVFCHLVPGLDAFFDWCQPAFTLEKDTYLHLIYDSEQDIKGLVQRYPDREVLEKLYPELRKRAETNDNFITTENLYSELDLAKLGIKTGLAIFEELQLLERNGDGIKLLPPVGKKLDESEIYRRGENLKKEMADFQTFQLEHSIEQIWEEILVKLNVDGQQILHESTISKTYFNIPKTGDDVRSTTVVEQDEIPPPIPDVWPLRTLNAFNSLRQRASKILDEDEAIILNSPVASYEAGPSALENEEDYQRKYNLALQFAQEHGINALEQGIGQLIKDQTDPEYDFTEDETNMLRAFQDALKDFQAQSEQSTESVEKDNEAAESDHSTKPSRANAKVTVEQVKEIRVRREAGESYGKLAKEFGLTPTGVRNIAMRNTWKDVE